MDSVVTFSSVNCQGLGNFQKRRDVFHYLKNKNYSVCFLQDTHFESKLEKYIKSEWGYECYFASHTSNARGVAILFNNNFEFKIKKVHKDTNGNFIIVIIEIKKEDYLLANLYGPNKDEPDFYRQFQNVLADMNVQNVIIAGDWNLVMDPSRDYQNYKHINNPKSRDVVDEIIDSLDLNDIWRELNPESRRFTWRRVNPFQQSRLDFFLISDPVVSYVESVDIECGYRTDHSMVTLTLKFGQSVNRNTFWKFNSSLLKDRKYLEEVNFEIDRIIDEYAAIPYVRENIFKIPKDELSLTVPDDVFLDFLLMKVRSKTIGYATMKKKISNEEEKELEKNMQALEENENKGVEDLRKLKNIQKKLKEIREKRIDGVILRSRARWIVNGERVTRYFCNMEKRHYISKNMARLIGRDGSVIADNEGLLTEVKHFYEKLYSERPVENCEIYDLVENIPTLSQEDAGGLEGDITIEEAGKVLKNMQNFKSPGSDGFTVEFFKVFWCKIGHFVVRALNESFRKGELTSTQKQGIITCIPKGDKSRDEIKNWRPISLLNVVYKIGSGCIAQRMKTVLPKLIDEDQTGFMQNRYIGDNLRLIYDLIDYVNKQNIPGMLLNIDFEKAFDSIDWSFMFKVLGAFGFGESIIRWVRTFYTGILSTVAVNGHTSSWFSIQRGCRQGDPISPYLFILCVEVLAIMVRENKNIKGIIINDVEHKIIQYADDTEFSLNGEQKSFESCIDVLDTFGKKSGLFLNPGKTSVIWLGSRKNSSVRYMQHLNMEWNPPKFKILGMWFTNDLSDCEKINYDDKFTEIKNLFRIWMKRCITPLGKIAILKSLILSKLTYLWLLLPNPPDHLIDRLQKMCYAFVWNNKQDRIARTVVVKHITEGGLGLPDIRQHIYALKLTWVRKLCNTSHKWKNILLANFPLISRIQEIGPNFFQVSRQVNSFWKDVFIAYKRFYYKIEPKSDLEVLAEPIMFNNRIRVGDQPLNLQNWPNAEIYNISHFLSNTGEFMKYKDFKNKYNIVVDYITYVGCVLSLKKYIKERKWSVCRNTGSENHAALQTILSITKGTKLYYQILTGDDTKLKYCSKWQEKLNCDINWKDCFKKVQKIQEISLKWFQLRIIQRIIATNIVLKEIGVTDDIMCSFCKNSRDSIEHMFWRCEIAQRFWICLQNLINEKCTVACNITLTESLILFGIAQNFKSDTVFDFIILFAKKFLYTCRMDNTDPALMVFRRKLSARYSIEKYNAGIQCRVHDFEDSWYPYKPLIDPD